MRPRTAGPRNPAAVQRASTATRTAIPTGPRTLLPTPVRRNRAIASSPRRCAACHAAPYYTDNLMHDLKTERFFKPEMINGMNATSDGAIKTFPLRGIKNSPPYMHDGRLLTLEDTVEFFNLVLGTKLTQQEKQDLVLFMRAL